MFRPRRSNPCSPASASPSPDAAYGFIYPANLETLASLGAGLRFFSPVAGEPLPACDALWLPGGYPELHAPALSANQPLWNALRAHIAAGKPLVGIRTASHPFHQRDQAPGPGLDEWRDFDATVLGGHYTGHHGNERQMKRTGVGLDRGYHSGPCVTSGSTVLMRQNAAGGWETWMSLSPMEVESQELACRHARGHTVVMGLGMGWVAANIALQPTVERVTVVERDGDVLELFGRCRVLEGLPESAARKVELVQADALQWQPQGAPVDFLYADIWLYLAEPQTLAEVQRMQANVHADQVYFWGQELVLGAMASAQAAPGTPAWTDTCALNVAL